LHDEKTSCHPDEPFPIVHGKKINNELKNAIDIVKKFLFFNSMFILDLFIFYYHLLGTEFFLNLYSVIDIYCLLYLLLLLIIIIYYYYNYHYFVLLLLLLLLILFIVLTK
jgi:hypothetical protein